VAGVHGFTAPGFEAVRDEFARNRHFRDELGASFAVYRGDRCLVDLWGGIADRATGRPWERDTLTPIFSCTKGLTAVCMLILVDRGALALDAAVAEYWPEFAAHGKGATTVADVLSHQSRLPAFRMTVGVAELQDHEALAAALAAQEPFTEDAAAHVYHAFTFGYLCGELVRRVDGRSLGRFFAEEVAAPLRLEAFIGLPPEYEPRVSVLERRDDYGELLAGLHLDDSVPYVRLLKAVYAEPPIADHPDEWFNRPELHRAEIPAVGGIATARALARLYACLAGGGTLDGVQLISPRTVALAREPHSVWDDEAFFVGNRFGLGFELYPEMRGHGPVEEGFGHSGLGGSVGAAWAAAGIGFGYVTNRLSDRQPDRRAAALLRAVDLCLGDGHPSGTLGAQSHRARLVAELAAGKGLGAARRIRARAFG
jgi:CubicO group peptidase (beta-lactamase class C family)